MLLCMNENIQREAVSTDDLAPIAARREKGQVDGNGPNTTCWRLDGVGGQAGHLPPWLKVGGVFGQGISED